jgi:hypothetical protein
MTHSGIFALFGLFLFNAIVLFRSSTEARDEVIKSRFSRAALINLFASLSMLGEFLLKFATP